MKHAFPLPAVAAALLFVAPFAVAQNQPGTPDGLLMQQFQLNEHPQLEFPASAPSAKYQHGPKSKLRLKGDDGDPDGCNLQCPGDGQ